jgi:hypothetical protein
MMTILVVCIKSRVQSLFLDAFAGAGLLCLLGNEALALEKRCPNGGNPWYMITRWNIRASADDAMISWSRGLDTQESKFSRNSPGLIIYHNSNGNRNSMFTDNRVW